MKCIKRILSVLFVIMVAFSPVLVEAAEKDNVMVESDESEYTDLIQSEVDVLQTESEEDMVTESAERMEKEEVPSLTDESLNSDSDVPKEQVESVVDELLEESIGAAAGTLTDPGFIVTGLSYEDQYDGTSYTVQVADSIETNDGKYNGKSVKNLYQTIHPIDTSFTLERVQNLKMQYKVADNNRVKITINGKTIKSGGKVDFSADEITVKAVIDGTTSIEYKVKFDIKHKLDCLNGDRTFSFAYPDNFPEDVILFDSYDITFWNNYFKTLTGVKATLRNAKNVKIADDSEIAEGQKTAIEPVAYYDDYNYKKVKLIPTGNGKVSGELVISCDNQEDIVITLSGTADWTSNAEKVRNLTKYVVYSFIVSDGADGGSTYSIDGKLPEGMSFDSNKKEIYGAPLKEGRYDFSVIKVKDGKSTTKTYTFLVSANCDECVMNETHQKSFGGFEKDWSKWEWINEVAEALTDINQDITLISEGAYDNYVKVWLNGKVLESGKDYTVEKGSTKVTLFAQTLKSKCNTITREQLERGFNTGYYGFDNTNTLCVEFNIHPQKSIRGEEYLRRTCGNLWIINDGKISIEKASVSGVSLSYGYSGKAYTPAITVKVNNKSLTKDKDYTVKYSNNKNPGTATITITGKGNYTGTKTKTFEIVDCVSSVVSGKTYLLIPKNNSKTAVCAVGGKMVNNTKVYITDRGNSESQKFKAVKNSDGTWKFINAKCELTLAVQQNSSALGAGLVLYDQTTRPAQNWKLSKKADNSFAIINSVTGYSIAMSDKSAVKGTTLSMAETASVGLQRFYIVETSAVSAPFDGTKSIRAAKDKHFAVNIASASKEDGANVSLYTYTNSNARKFKIIYSGGGYYRLVNVNSGLCLTIKDNSNVDGANIIQSKWKGYSSQRWKITKNSDGTVTITNMLGTVLHLLGNRTVNNTNIHARKAASTTAQKWYLN